MPEQIRNGQMSYEVISRSQTEIKDLIGNPPGWLLRSGITIVFVFTFVILIGSYYFKYPDKLVGYGTLTSTKPPIEILSRTSGYINDLHFNDGEKVQKGEPIVYISNTTNESQLEEIQSWMREFKKIENPKDYLNLPFTHDLQLGIVQNEYANLQLRYNELHQLLTDGLVFQQMNNIEREIEKIKKLNRSLQREREIFSEELGLIRNNYQRNSGLKEDGVVSALELEKIKGTLLQNERQYEVMNNSIIQNNIRIEQLGLETIKLKRQRSNSLKDQLFMITEIITRMKTSIENWNKTYSIVAPIDGVLSFNKNINIKHNLDQGDVLGYMIPNEKTENYVSAIYPINSIGKIKTGQAVILKFDAYPNKEFGVVMSTVGDISKLPELSREGLPEYELQIPLDSIIVTDYNKIIKYNPKMTVIAEVITEDKTIFERLFNQFLSLVK